MGGGETLGVGTRGRLVPMVHFVDERFAGLRRISMPFFLRPRPNADIIPPPYVLPPPLPTAAPAAAAGAAAAAASSPLQELARLYEFSAEAEAEAGTGTVQPGDSGGQAPGPQVAPGLRPGQGQGEGPGTLTQARFLDEVVFSKRPWGRGRHSRPDGGSYDY
ncbi:hypothetical protein TSOC_010086 [Tetrabaena socialis]|uniref:Uncharacterized protein n=1 Tax=Tetrabaena socialis TaxID=47790 RepID=A0A2J7ZU63_9CHLO|nr:hypothetical protein TSOC_010086 [Tetrabaena socialis]|eukprot:PNH03816.1 hypothetical protein TSOC_010086 [Tetrabaena socialis]